MQKDLSSTWRPLGPIADGGTVFAVSIAGDLLLTENGVLAHADGGWRPLGPRPPLAHANALAAADGVCWVGGLGGIVYAPLVALSAQWSAAWIDQVAAPITCLLPSPRYREDRVLLAGTAGAGVLRSIDGGRRWRLSNFGLQEFTILCLAAAGGWGRREVAFAGTLAGLYRSPGGGRAWQRVGLDGVVVTAVAADPGFDASGLALAGGEGGELFRTGDGGRTWAQVATLDAPINALTAIAGPAGVRWLAGAADGALRASADGGATWQAVHQGAHAILCLGEGCAGLRGGGVLVWDALTGPMTTDEGPTAPLPRPMTTDEGPTAPLPGSAGTDQDNLDGSSAPRLAGAHLPGIGFTRLRGDLALAPYDGLWEQQADGGWAQILPASRFEPILDALPAAAGLLLARAEGVALHGAGGEQLTLPTELPVVALGCAGQGDRGTGGQGDREAHVSVPPLLQPPYRRKLLRLDEAQIIAGTADARLYRSGDGGRTWEDLGRPGAGLQLIRLAYLDNGTVALACLTPDGQAQIWRLAADQPESARFTRWPAGSAEGGALHLAPAAGGVLWAALGAGLNRWDGAGWQAIAALPAPIGGLAVGPGGICLALAAGQVWRCASDGAATPLPWPAEAAEPLLLDASAGGLRCVDAAGVVWGA